MPGRWCSRPREVFILINELSSLSKALEQAGIVPLQSYRNYIPLPNVSAKAPCIRIWVKGGQVVDFEAIDRALAAAGPQDGEKLPLLQGKRDILNGGDGGCIGGEVFGEVCDLEIRCRHGVTPFLAGGNAPALQW